MWSHLKEKGFKLPKTTAREISKKVGPVLRAMEKKGIKVDLEVFGKLTHKLEKRVAVLDSEIHHIVGFDFNISSPVQMQEVLFEKLKLPTADLKKTKTGISTAAAELKKIESKHKIISLILEYRELTKLLSTYLKPLPAMVDENDRLHTTYGQDTNTSRLTSSDPNLQNIPIKGRYGPEIRKAFVAEKGNKLIVADYSQIELRVVACLAEDKVMMEAFEKGEDIHAKTASELFNIDIKKVNRAQRSLAKTVNFGILYGMSPYGLSQALSIDQKDAAEYIMKYFSVHLGIKDYCTRMIERGRGDGEVETLFGYKRELLNINSKNNIAREADERIAINTPVQGTAAEILKLAMIELNKKLKSGNMLLTVHDELVVEVPAKEARKTAKLVKETMENVVKLCVPIEVEVGIGDNWEECK